MKLFPWPNKDICRLRADGEMRSRLEKTADIKELDDSILGLKRQISKLKDQVIQG